MLSHGNVWLLPPPLSSEVDGDRARHVALHGGRHQIHHQPQVIGKLVTVLKLRPAGVFGGGAQPAPGVDVVAGRQLHLDRARTESRCACTLALSSVPMRDWKSVSSAMT